MAKVDDKWVLILLEEQNEERGLTHVKSDEAFRYPKPYDGDLYVVGYDVNENIHFLLVESKENGETIIRVIEDEDLFQKLLSYYRDPNRLPSSDADEKLRRKIGENISEEKMEKIIMTKLPMDHI